MAKKQDKNQPLSSRSTRAASTPEARENQLIALAYDLVEQRMINGTASAQETTHFLKLGSERARLEKEKLRRENDVLVAKKEAFESSKHIEELYSNALNAMRNYSGQTIDQEVYDDRDNL